MSNINEILVRRRVRNHIRSLIRKRALFGHAYRERRPSIGDFAKKGLKQVTGEDFLKRLEEVASSKGSHLLLRQLFNPPFFTGEREHIRDHPFTNKWADRARYSLVCLMSLIDHSPLFETHIPRANTIAHAFGGEYSGFSHSPCKLTTRPATVAPNRPMGPSLFDDKRLDIGPPCPDIVAFICIEQANTIRHAGGKAYSVDRIRKEYIARHGAGGLSLLDEPRFMIQEDVRLGGGSFGFQRLVPTNILGLRHLNGVDRSYMRYIRGRTLAADNLDANAAYALANLHNVVDGLEQDPETAPVDLRRGDVWLVNNRRMATQWNTTAERVSLGRVRSEVLKEKERIILRMSFYSPTPVS